MAIDEDALIDAVQDATQEFTMQAYDRFILNAIVSKLKYCFREKAFWSQFISRNDELLDYTVRINHVDRELEMSLKTDHTQQYVYVTLTF